MVKAWRTAARPMLAGFLALDVLFLVYTRTFGTGLNAHQPISRQVVWLALDAWLAWRIWRRGRIAWTVLVVITGSLVLLIVIGAAWPWGWYLLGIQLLLVAQLILLLSPAVRRHVRESRHGLR